MKKFHITKKAWIITLITILLILALFALLFEVDVVYRPGEGEELSGYWSWRAGWVSTDTDNNNDGETTDSEAAGGEGGPGIIISYRF